MPEMDGIELARRAAELDPGLKIMFITGFAAVALHPDSPAPKDAKVLSKPFHLRDLVRRGRADDGRLNREPARRTAEALHLCSDPDISTHFRGRLAQR